MRMIQQAAPMPAMKAGCLTTSEICCDRGFSWLMDSVTRPEASEDVIGGDVRAGLGGTKVDLLVQIRIRQWKECEHRGERSKRGVLLNFKMDQNAGISIKKHREHQSKASSVSTRRNDRPSRSLGVWLVDLEPCLSAFQRPFIAEPHKRLPRRRQQLKTFHNSLRAT